MSSVVVMDCTGEMLTIGFGKLGFLVQKTEDTSSLGLNEINTILIIHKLDILDSKTLLLVQLLFILQDSLVEELLQLFIAIVDTKLLKAVNCKVFKASNIKDANVVGRGLERDAFVDPVDDVVKQVAVKSLGQGISGISGTAGLQGDLKNTSMTFVRVGCRDWRSLP